MNQEVGAPVKRKWTDYKIPNVCNLRKTHLKHKAHPKDKVKIKGKTKRYSKEILIKRNLGNCIIIGEINLKAGSTRDKEVVTNDPKDKRFNLLGGYNNLWISCNFMASKHEKKKVIQS